MDKTAVTALAREMTTLAELYGREVSKPLFEMYVADLEAFDIRDILRAIRAHRQDPQRGQYFPKPADIIDKINGTVQESALVAWPEVLRLASNSRAAQSPDPITEQVVGEMGGWRRFGMSTTQELTWMQKEFIERYQAHLRGHAESPLLGNTSRTRSIGQVVHIGSLLGHDNQK